MALISLTLGTLISERPFTLEGYPVSVFRERAVPKNDPPEFSFQFFPPKVNAKGIEAVRPIVWAVSIAVVCYAVSWFL